MSGFVDLRLNQDSRSGDDSFWPSFTDIMAVVVMIFLITTSVLILRNWELIRQITQTSRAEQEAMELARETSKEKATVEEQLSDAQYRNRILRLELLRSEQERQKRQSELTAARELSAQLRASLAELDSRFSLEQQARRDVDEQLQNVMTQRSSLQLRLDQESQEKASLRETLQRLTEQFAELQALEQASQSALSRTAAELAAQRARFTELERASRLTATQLSELQNEAQLTAEEMAQLRTALSAQRQTSSQVEERYESLSVEYDDLKVKYDKLFRPARTATGKHVVEVRHWRSDDGITHLSLRAPGEAEFGEVDNDTLHDSLAALRDRFPDTLYVRIIFPEESGLSYAEAWGFTQDLLARYDYYHRIEAESAAEQ